MEFKHLIVSLSHHDYGPPQKRAIGRTCKPECLSTKQANTILKYLVRNISKKFTISSFKWFYNLFIISKHVFIDFVVCDPNFNGNNRFDVLPLKARHLHFPQFHDPQNYNPTPTPKKQLYNKNIFVINNFNRSIILFCLYSHHHHTKLNSHNILSFNFNFLLNSHNSSSGYSILLKKDCFFTFKFFNFAFHHEQRLFLQPGITLRTVVSAAMEAARDEFIAELGEN